VLRHGGGLVDLLAGCQLFRDLITFSLRMFSGMVFALV
jgi:hypothetical protein